MDRMTPIVFLLRGISGLSVLLLAVWAEFPWLAITALVGLCSSLLTVELMPEAFRERTGNRALTAAWVCAALIPVTLLFGKGEATYFDGYYAIMAWCVAACVLPTRKHPSTRHWKKLSMVWAFLGGFVWLVASYVQNRPVAFHVGVLINLALLVLCRIRFRMSAFGIQTVNTLILLLIGLPIADLFFHPVLPANAHRRQDGQYSSGRATREPSDSFSYSYETAKMDPSAFGRWWNHYLEAWNVMAKDIFVSDPSGVLPFRLRPDSHGHLFQSLIAINSMGLRGKEIPSEKGDTYRILALGESTTFGCTLKPEGRPWPELLEQMIRDRLMPPRPVEVINAGVPAYDLEDNIHQLLGDLLSLKPDMIISYHGYNGFKMLDAALPRSHGEPAPGYRVRPLKLLAVFEYRLKLMFYKQRQILKLALHPSAISQPMETAYARGYKRLIQIARTNGIRLVLGNFSMAVNSHSDPEIVNFYRAGFPLVRWQIKANTVHSMIVKQIAEEHPEVRFVDTHFGLDGEHEKFIDLVHLTQEGRRRLAETFFSGVEDVLKKDLTDSDSTRAEAGRSR